VDEQEWLQCTDPLSMLNFLLGKVDSRKLRLFACACTRLIGERRQIEHHRVVEVGERYADKLATSQEVEQERLRVLQTPAYSGFALTVWEDIEKSIVSIFGHEYNLWDKEQYVPIARDIFGNPFRPVKIDNRWLTSTVIDLASAIYAERAFDRMGVLCDALMDAGCNSDEIIAHCRASGPHVRGCWVIDLLLGKS
jgi:hypothetical protein